MLQDRCDMALGLGIEVDIVVGGCEMQACFVTIVKKKEFNPRQTVNAFVIVIISSFCTGAFGSASTWWCASLAKQWFMPGASQ